jgi:hypothetical protein
MAVHMVVLWILWTEKNDVVFNNVKWTPIKLLQRIWLGMLDYGRVDWSRLQMQCKKNLDKLPTLLKNFEKRWCRNNIFARMHNNEVKWILSGPMAGFVFQVH